MVVNCNYGPTDSRRCRPPRAVLHPPRRLDTSPAVAPTIRGSPQLSAKQKRYAFAVALAIAALAMYLGIIISVGTG